MSFRPTSPRGAEESLLVSQSSGRKGIPPLHSVKLRFGRDDKASVASLSRIQESLDDRKRILT